MIINSKQLKNIMAKQGIRSFSELSRKASLHRNSLIPYLKEERDILSEVPFKISETLGVDPRLLIKEQEIQFKDQFNILPIIREYSLGIKERHCFFLFGSRASGMAKKYSDYDIAYAGLDSEKGLEIKEDLLQSFEDYPVKVDLLNFDNAPNWFLVECKMNFIFICGAKSLFYNAISRVYEAKEQS